MSKNKKYWKRRLGLSQDLNEYLNHLDLRKIPELDDTGLEVVLAGVKGVNMLDLDETEITNASIALLTKLHYVNELRAKNCYIDNDCIVHLNKISSLTFLHVRMTGITIDGLLKLTNRSNLRTLMFSSTADPAFHSKMIRLQSLLPRCEFVVDSVPYIFNDQEPGPVC